MSDENDESGFFPRPSPEDETKRFKEILRELWMTPGDLATYMNNNRDYRDFGATIRSIQRMISGETRVSGEMMVIANTLLKQRLRLKARHPNLTWQRNEYGVLWAQVDDWYVFISPQSKGRFILYCRHGNKPSDYSPPFGRWLDSLDEAKEKALFCVEEGMNEAAMNLHLSERR